jgi:uncharacterized protein (DUF697 family)
MPEPQTPTAEAIDPKYQKKGAASPSINEQESRKLGDEQDRLVKELREGKISLGDFEQRWKKVQGIKAADAAAEAEELRTVKLNLYEAFVEGKLTRGALDRELDRLYARNGQAETLAPAKTPRQPRAEKIVKRYMWWTAGGGLIPIPVADLAVVTGFQLLMLRRLCQLYGVPFSEEWGKTVLSALLGGIAPSYFKSIPGVGTAVGMITAPIFNAASTYSVGKIFIQHFESGGTLLTFDPAKMKNYFADYYREGAQIVNG